jgi:hypothetical protein
MNKAKIALSLMASLMVVFGYQNCTLHQSEQRKILESTGFAPGPVTSCMPLISNNSVAEIFGAKSVWVGIENDELGQVGRCRFSLEQLKGPQDAIVCDYDLRTEGPLRQKMDELKISEVLPNGEAKSDQNSVLDKAQEVIFYSSENVYLVYSARQNSSKGVLCQSSLESSLSNSSEMAKQITIQMAKQIKD